MARGISFGCILGLVAATITQSPATLLAAADSPEAASAAVQTVDPELFRQAEMYEASRKSLSLNQASSSLDYLRRCASVGRESQEGSTEELTEKCAREYEETSMQIVKGQIALPPDVGSVADMFLQTSSSDGFPKPDDVTQVGVWMRGTEGLRKYWTAVHEGDVETARGTLDEMAQEIEWLRAVGMGGYGKSMKMSRLQMHLMSQMLDRIKAVNSGRGEL